LPYFVKTETFIPGTSSFNLWPISTFPRRPISAGYALNLDESWVRHPVSVGYEISKGVQTSAGTFFASNICAGSCRPPQFLPSGIGPASTLATHSIPLVLDLPGIGNNVHDHLVSHRMFNYLRALPLSSLRFAFKEPVCSLSSIKRLSGTRSG